MSDDPRTGPPDETEHGRVDGGSSPATSAREEPMTGILIHRPVEVVFAFVMAIEETPRWRPRMSDVAWTSAGPPGLGSRFRVTVKVLGISYHFRFEVVVWDPPFAATFRQVSAIGSIDSHMEWRPEEAGCRYRIGATYETAGWMKPFVPLIASSVLRQNLDDLMRLKRLLEMPA